MVGCQGLSSRSSIQRQSDAKGSMGHGNDSLNSHMVGCDLALVRWFLRSLRGSRRQEGSSPKQIQAGSTVHLTLEPFEAVDLSLSLPAAPWQCECRPNCSAILLQTGSNRLNRRDTAGTGLGEPSLQSGGGVVAFRSLACCAHECREATREAGHCLCFGISATAWATAAAPSSLRASAGFTRAQAKRLGDKRAGGPPDRGGVSLRQR